MRRYCILLAAALVFAAAPAWSQCTFKVKSQASRPALTGRLVYEDSTTGQLYLYDFQAVTLTNFTATWAATANENPVFSPDGKAVLFSAVQSDQRHLYYWKIGAAQPVNLTLAMGNLRNEDPKFAPSGKAIVWKQSFNIVTAPLNFDGSGNPSLGAVTAITTNGVQGTTTEASAPVFSPTAKDVYYYTGSGANAQVQKYDTTTHVFTPFPKTAGVEYYYPVDPDLYDFLYVSWLSSTNMFDKIFLYSQITNTSTAWNPTDCAANNSDPAPVDEDYFIYSRDDNSDGDRYELYLGQIATGFAWTLTPLHVNIRGDALLGANYTNAR
jgi:Tol biopolymer transport system component